MRGTYFFVFAAVFFGLFFFVPNVHAALTIAGGSNATTTPSVATSITGFQIVGPSASTTPVKLRATNGTLSLSSVSGVTMSGSGSGTVNLSGTVENLNTALSTLTYTRNSTGTDTLEVSLVSPSEVFFPDNGHLYEYIASAGTWDSAKTKAEALTRYGATGYLTTILTSSENSFVAARLGGDGWMGASDSATENDWKWVTGPEVGTSFWSGTSGGSTVGGNYANWNTGEPNNSSDEDCAQFYSSTGRWNDLSCGSSSLPGYVAEFGSDAETLNVVATTISIVTADVPAVTTLSPVNGATGISTSSNLVIGFTKTVTGNTGTITIRKSSDDSIVESIDVTSGLVTSSGSNSITINPAAVFDEGTEYYVLIPANAFKDSSENAFEGILTDTIWVFTTDDVTAPILSFIASSPASTTATITWTTNENASTKVVYGLTSSASSAVTSETDTSPRVTSHSKSISNLLPCTTYQYAVVSKDAFANIATSTDLAFTTTGCEYEASPTQATSTTIQAGNTGTTNLTESGKTFVVTADAPIGTSLVIQIKAVPSLSVLTTLGRPGSAPNEVGSTVFDVKAIVNADTIFDSFDTEVTIEYEYSEAEISNINESSLWLYHYTGGAWVALNDCSLDTSVNTISCTTPSFSIFGLFGRQIEETSNRISSGTHFGCKDKNASNYEYFSRHKQELCEYETPGQALQRIVNEHRDLLIQAYESGIAIPQNILIMLGIENESLSVRDLEYGMEGEDVRALQTLLVGQGYTIPAGPTDYFGLQTQYALDTYQVDNDIAPRGGYFGPITRAQMKKAELAGLWW